MVPGELQHVGPRLVRYCVFKTPIYSLEQISIGEKNLLSNITIVLQFYSSKFNTDSHTDLFMRPIALWEIICSFDSVVRIAQAPTGVWLCVLNQSVLDFPGSSPWLCMEYWSGWNWSSLRLDTTPNNLDTAHLIKAGMLYNTKSQCVFIDCIVVQLFVDRLLVCALYKNQHKSFNSSFQ